MPDEWEERFDRLNDFLKELELPGVDVSNRDAFTTGVSELISELSPFAETQYLPRLEPLRWAVIALDAYHQSPDPNDDAVQLAEDLRVIADAAPASIPTALPEELRERANELEGEVERRFVKCAIRQAREYLGLSESQDVVETCPDPVFASPIGLQEFHASLALLENDPDHATDIKVLLRQLRQEMARQDAKEMERKWIEARTMTSDGGSVDQTVISLLLHEVETAIAIAALHGIDVTAYDELALQLRNAEDKARERNRLGYQKWALREIRNFESSLDGISQEANDATEKMLPLDLPDGVVPDSWTEELYFRVQMAMIEHLAPINPALLDEPILRRYRREFDRGWTLLEERIEQTCVAVASTMTEKRNLRNFDNDTERDLSDAERSELEEGECAL